MKSALINLSVDIQLYLLILKIRWKQRVSTNFWDNPRIKPLTTKAYDRRASGDCGTSGAKYYLVHSYSVILVPEQSRVSVWEIDLDSSVRAARRVNPYHQRSA